MRLEFIHPIYLPPVAESFLRKDFNFCEYLAYAYGKTLSAFFNTSWVTLLAVIAMADLVKMGNLNDEDTWRAYLNFSMPFAFLLAFLFYYLDFTRIQKVVYP